MCQAVVRRLYNPSKDFHVRKVAHLLAQALRGKEKEPGLRRPGSASLVRGTYIVLGTFCPGSFFPRVATLLTQSPWFLNMGLPLGFSKFFQPLFLHSAVVWGYTAWPSTDTFNL